MKKSLDEILKDLRKGGKLRVVCCICKKVIKEGPEDNISDGECEPCCTKKLWMEGLPVEEITRFLNAMEEKTS